jgi:hypothetical protein
MDEQMELLTKVASWQRRNFLYTFVLFLIWPFSALWVAVKNYQNKYSKNIIWLFCIFSGATFVILSEEYDSSRYRDDLVTFSHKHELSLLELIPQEFERKADVIQPIVTYIVSRFTDNFHVLFAVFGLIFGYFYSRNIWYLIEKGGNSLKKTAIPFVFLFALIMPYWTINGFRFNTATHIFLFCALTYLLERKRIYVLLSATTMLLHFSFFLPVVILGLYSILGNRPFLYFSIFITSTFIIELDVQFLKNYMESLPAFIQFKVRAYTYDEYIAFTKDSLVGLNWYVVARRTGLRYLVYFFIIYTYLFKPEYTSKGKLANLYNFGTLFTGLANILSVIPSVERFQTVSSFFVVGYAILFIQFDYASAVVRRWYPILLFPILLYIIVEIREGFDYMGLGSVLGNFFIAPFFENDVALINYIK